MRDVVVSTRPLSYRSAGSIRSLPTTCTHEPRRGRGSYTTGREIPLYLSLSLPLSLPSPLFARFLAPVVRSTPLGWRETREKRRVRSWNALRFEMSGWKFSFSFRNDALTRIESTDIQSTTSRERERERDFLSFFKKSGKERCDVDRKRGYYPGNLARSYKHGVTTGIGRVSIYLSLSLSLRRSFVSTLEGCALSSVGASLNRVGACRLDGAGC